MQGIPVTFLHFISAQRCTRVESRTIDTILFLFGKLQYAGLDHAIRLLSTQVILQTNWKPRLDKNVQ